MMRALLFCSFAVLTWLTARPSVSLARPAQVLIIRHAEKPEDPDETTLSDKGYRRAQELVRVLGPGNRRFKVPEKIFAQTPHDEDGSVRSIETARPLAQSLNLRVSQQYEVNEGWALAEHLLESPAYDGKIVLVVWGKDEIPEIAQELGARRLPNQWPKGVYDRIWRLVFDGGRVKSEDLPMRALRGDSRD